MTADDGQPGLAPFQLEVARMFFALPASRGFLLAGGAALLAQHLTARPTEDLDFFTAPERGHVPAARDALEAAARQRGWITEPIHDSETFCRMVIRSAETGVLIDLAVNAPPDLPGLRDPGRADAGPGRARGQQAPRLVRPGCRTGLRRHLCSRPPQPGDRSSQHRPVPPDPAHPANCTPDAIGALLAPPPPLHRPLRHPQLNSDLGNRDPPLEPFNRRQPDQLPPPAALGG
jgi:Nucleotidyl transferase AbiEii toxin, Type IV TA system